MPTSRARIPTTRARRYLAQLGKHSAHLGPHLEHRPGPHDAHAAPPVALPTTWSDTDGAIDFGWARCTVHAGDDALVLTAEADDEEALARIQDGIARRLERIGHRDALAVTWSEPPAGGPVRPPPTRPPSSAP